jgi:thiamine-monophosphate kinase
VNQSPSFRSENEWTSHLEKMLSRRADVVAGIGDDAAVVNTPAGDFDLVYTTDAVVESVHFHPGTEPHRIGHKMAGRLLSDIAAMGAEPDHMLLNLVVPPGFPASAMAEIYEGAQQLAAEFGAVIIGGDTMTSNPLALHGFASGHVPAGTAVLRSGAKIGDHIYVTGKLGGSLAGKHLDFIPRVREGIWLRGGCWPTAMMDISDGLARDLPRICTRSGVGAHLFSECIPTDHGIEHALGDGEDYELLFTVADERCDIFEAAWKLFSSIACTRIGTMQGPPDQIILVHPDGRNETLRAGGYDHLGK